MGKTTISSAFALSCARKGQRTLLIELNVHDKVSSMFGAAQVGTDIVEIERNLYAVNVTPEAAMEEYAVMMLKVRLVYKAVFENRIMRSFLRAIPGLNELVMLGKAYYHVIEEDHGRPVWDMIVVDAPATGHGLFLLRIPSVITSILSSGHMYEEALRILAVLQNPEITSMNLVTLPEEMPVNETAMLYESTLNELKIPMDAVIVNGKLNAMFTADEQQLLNDSTKDIEETWLKAMIDAANFRVMRAKIQQGHAENMARLVPLPNITIPYKFVTRMDFPTLLNIADDLTRQIEEGES